MTLPIFVASLLLSSNADLTKAAKDSPAYAGLAARFRSTGLAFGDLDGDGDDDVVAAFAPRPVDLADEDEPGGGERGALLVLVAKAGGLAVGWCGAFESSWPTDVRVDGRTIRFTSVKSSDGGDARSPGALVAGRDLFLLGDRRSPFHGAVATATSTLDSARAGLVGPELVLDGQGDTVWAEGVPGTGVDERLEIRFARPAAVGIVGVLGGDARSPRAWRDSNRVHRAELVAELEADRGDGRSGVEFSELGLGSGGDRFKMGFSDARRFKWSEVARRGVVSLRLEIHSVYLGDRYDDTFVAELLLGELLPDPSPAVASERRDAPPAPQAAAVQTP